MANLFYDCPLLSYVSFNFKAEKLKDLSGIFHNCNRLTSIELNLFNTKNLEVLDKAFKECKYIKYSKLNIYLELTYIMISKIIF